MDPSLYKSHTTTRGLTYHYFFSPPQANKRTILFLHGYPCTSDSWHKQVSFFIAKGYGVLAPDMLGYGGTDKPGVEELDKYSPTGIAEDLVDLLEHEKVGRVVSIGHDWGALTNSRIAQLHSDRFDAFGFLIVGYIPPNPDMNVQVVNAMLKQVLGFEIFGYQMMHAEPDAAELIESHWDSYFSLIFTANPEIWKEHLGPVGALRAWLSADRKTEIAGYITEADKARITNALLGDGKSMTAPLLWYTNTVKGMKAADDKTIPKEKYVIHKPVFTAAGMKDPFCAASFRLMKPDAVCTNVTFKEYDGDHWIQWSHAEELNRDLLAWLEGLPE